MKASITDLTQGDSLYPVSLFAQPTDDGVDLYNGDGAQRLRALTDSGATHTTAQVVLAWHTPQEAMKAGFAANQLRFEMQDADIFQVIRFGGLDDGALKAITGFNDSKLRRYKLLAADTKVSSLVADKTLGFTKAVTLLEAVDSNPKKRTALHAELDAVLTTAQKSQETYQTLHKQGNLDKKHLDKIKLSYWVNKAGDELTAIGKNIEADLITEDQDGVVRVQKTIQVVKKRAIVGAEEEWKSELALYEFFGKKIKDVPLESFDEIIRDLPTVILQKVKGARERAKELQGEPSLKTDAVTVPPPTPQNPAATFSNE
jgi:hypothetical protein